MFGGFVGNNVQQNKTQPSEYVTNSCPFHDNSSNIYAGLITNFTVGAACTKHSCSPLDKNKLKILPLLILTS